MAQVCVNTWCRQCSWAKQELPRDDTGASDEEDEAGEAKEGTTRSCLSSGFLHPPMAKREKIVCTDDRRDLSWHTFSSYRLIQNLIFENDPRLGVIKKEIKINARFFLFVDAM